MKVSTAIGLNLVFIIVRSSSAVQFYIIHTGDVHSHFEMFNWLYQPCKVEDMKPNDRKTKCFGGVARRCKFVMDIRRRNRNVLLLDAGDQYQGTLWFNAYKGNISKHYLDYLQYDAMALGNHEFDNGPEGLDPLLVSRITPILCANLKKTPELPANILSYVDRHIKVTIEGQSIGVIGYLTPEVVHLARTGNLTFEDEIDVLQKEVKSLVDSGTKIIVGLGHSGIDRDKEIARAVPDIDIIVGGHSHTLLLNGENKWNDRVDGEYPQVINNGGGRKTLIVHAGMNGKYIGVLNVTFDSGGKVTSWSGNTVVIDETTPEDLLAAKYLNAMIEAVHKLNRITVGYATDLFEGSLGICRVEECTIGNLFADAVVERMQELCEWPNFTLAFVNGGCVRASLSKGAIKYGSLLTIFPFNTNFIMATLDGSTLLEAFEHSVKSFSRTRRHGKFLQVSGFKVRYDLTKPNGKRVVKLQTRKCYKCSEFEDVVETKRYEVAMPKFLADGGDGYEMLKESKVRPYDIQDLEIIKSHIEKHSPVRPVLQNRIVGTELPRESGVQVLASNTNAFCTLILTVLSLLFADFSHVLVFKFRI